MSNIVESNKFEEALTTALKVPGVRVDRSDFLIKALSKYVSEEQMSKIIKTNTIEAGLDLNLLDKVAKGLISKRTNQSASASFLAGIPGGVLMAATVPGDVLQFFAVALKMAQELAYLYGYEDLSKDDNIDSENVKNELILFLGVMFGVSGANSAIRLVSTNIAKQALKKLPQKALTKTIYYPIIKKISASIGLKMTKSIFAKGASKAVPILGGVVSGGLTYVSMKPMGNRLKDALTDGAKNNYTEADLKKDIKDLERETGEVIDIEFEDVHTEEEVAVTNVDEIVYEPEKSKQLFDDENIAEEIAETNQNNHDRDSFNPLEEIKEAKKLLDDGIITEEEFIQIKKKLIDNMGK